MTVSSRYSAALDAVRRSEELAKPMEPLNFGDHVDAELLARVLELQAARLEFARRRMEEAVRLVRQAGEK